MTEGSSPLFALCAPTVAIFDVVAQYIFSRGCEIDCGVDGCRTRNMVLFQLSAYQPQVEYSFWYVHGVHTCNMTAALLLHAFGRTMYTLRVQSLSVTLSNLPTHFLFAGDTDSGEPPPPGLCTLTPTSEWQELRPSHLETRHLSRHDGAALSRPPPLLGTQEQVHRLGADPQEGDSVKCNYYGGNPSELFMHALERWDSHMRIVETRPCEKQITLDDVSVKHSSVRDSSSSGSLSVHNFDELDITHWLVTNITALDSAGNTFLAVFGNEGFRARLVDFNFTDINQNATQFLAPMIKLACSAPQETCSSHISISHSHFINSTSIIPSKGADWLFRNYNGLSGRLPGGFLWVCGQSIEITDSTFSQCGVGVDSSPSVRITRCRFNNTLLRFTDTIMQLDRRSTSRPLSVSDCHGTSTTVVMYSSAALQFQDCEFQDVRVGTLPSSCGTTTSVIMRDTACKSCVLFIENTAWELINSTLLTLQGVSVLDGRLTVRNSRVVGPCTFSPDGNNPSARCITMLRNSVLHIHASVFENNPIASLSSMDGASVGSVVVSDSRFAGPLISLDHDDPRPSAQFVAYRSDLQISESIFENMGQVLWAQGCNADFTSTRFFNVSRIASREFVVSNARQKKERPIDHLKVDLRGCSFTNTLCAFRGVASAERFAVHNSAVEGGLNFECTCPLTIEAVGSRDHMNIPPPCRAAGGTALVSTKTSFLAVSSTSNGMTTTCQPFEIEIGNEIEWTLSIRLINAHHELQQPLKIFLLQPFFPSATDGPSTILFHEKMAQQTFSSTFSWTSSNPSLFNHRTVSGKVCAYEHGTPAPHALAAAFDAAPVAHVSPALFQQAASQCRAPTHLENSTGCALPGCRRADAICYTIPYFLDIKKTIDRLPAAYPHHTTLSLESLSFILGFSCLVRVTFHDEWGKATQTLRPGQAFSLRVHSHVFHHLQIIPIESAIKQDYIVSLAPQGFLFSLQIFEHDTAVSEKVYLFRVAMYIYAVIGVLFIPLIILLFLKIRNWRFHKAEKAMLKHFPLAHTPNPEEHTGSREFKEIAVDMADISIMQHNMAGGGQGSIVLGIWKGSPVVVKTYHSPQLDVFFTEMKILYHLRHPNIVLIMGAMLKPSPAVVLQFLPRGSVNLVIKTDPQALTWELRQRIVEDCACGLTYLHSKNILHMDLKSGNVLLDKDFTAKLTDFGMSRVCTTDCSANTVGFMGSFRWMAPELMQERCKPTPACDVYSFSTLLWEIASLNTTPYEDILWQHEVCLAARQGITPVLPSDTPHNFRIAAQAGWSLDPDQRPSIEEVARTLKAV